MQTEFYSLYLLRINIFISRVASYLIFLFIELAQYGTQHDLEKKIMNAVMGEGNMYDKEVKID